MHLNWQLPICTPAGRSDQTRIGETTRLGEEVPALGVELYPSMPSDLRC